MEMDGYNWFDNHTCTGVTECRPHTVEYYGYLCLQFPLSVIGFFLNAINIITFTAGRRNFRSWGNLHSFLCVLSVTDCCYMVFIAPFGLVLCILHDNWYVNNIYLIYIYKPLTSFCATSSVWITMIIAVDRYISIKNVTWRKRYTAGHAKLTLLVVMVSSAALNMPFYFIQRVQKNAIVVDTEFGQSFGYEVYNYIRSFLAKYVPIVIVAWASIALCMALLRHKQKRRAIATSNSATYSKRAHWKRLSMILGISIMLVACQSLEPLTTLPVATAITKNDCVFYTQTYRDLVMFTALLEQFSYASNFLFYFLCNTVIRQTWTNFLHFGGGSKTHVSTVSEHTQEQGDI